MSSVEGKVAHFLRAVRLGLVKDVPPDAVTCEFHTKLTCDSIRAATCGDRILVERQERRRSLVEFGKTGT